MTNRDINTTLRFILDKSTLQQVQSGVMSVEDAFEQVQNKMLQTRKTLVDISESAKKYEAQAKRGLVASTAFVTGLFLYANRYVKSLEESNAVSRKWEATSKQIEKSQERIGQVVATQVLPLYQKGANIVSQIANFVEQNPEVIKAALNIGLLIVGFNALALIAAKGVRFVADATYIATVAMQVLASKQMEQAANKQLAASAAMNMSGNQWAQQFRGQVFGTGNVSPIAAAGLIVAGLVAAGTLVTIIDNLIAKTKLGDAIQSSQRKILETSDRPYPGVISPALRQEYGLNGQENAITKFIDKIKEFFGVINETATQIEQVNNRLKGSEFEEQIVKAYTQMKEEEKQLIEDYEKQKSDIIKRYNADVISSIQRNASAINSILNNYNKAISNANQSYLKDSKRSEENLKNERARIIRDGGEEIKRIEENLQDRLLKLRRDHEDKVSNFVARRDAIGLRDEIRNYNRQRDEEISNTNKEVMQRRRDLAIKLQDLQNNYRQERDMRYAEYVEQMNQAKQQRDEQLKAQAERYAQERFAMLQAKNEQLRQLKETLTVEQNRKREAFIAMVRDLDASLLGEQRKKQQYYQMMLADAEKFLQDYRRRLPGGSSGTIGGGISSFPVRDSGGYASNPGLYHLAKNGVEEFVLKGGLTKFAENLVGGRLTQEKLSGLLMQRSMQTNTINDYSRYDSRLSKADIRMIEEMQSRKMQRLFT